MADLKRTMPVVIGMPTVGKSVQPALACWECETLSDTSVTVNLQISSGVTRKLRLCSACYTRIYLPLVSEDVSAAAFVKSDHSVGGLNG